MATETFKDPSVKQDKLTDWKNEPTLDQLKADYDMASGTKNTQVAKIEDWLDQLHVRGAYKPKKREGRSSVQPKLIRKQAEWRYASLSEPFLNDENIFDIAPKTWVDTEAAKQNKMILNYQFNNQINKVKLIDDMVRTGVNEGTVIARVSWNYEEAKVEDNVPTFTYEEADPNMVPIIEQAVQMYQVHPRTIDNLTPELKESVLATVENGRPIHAMIMGYEVGEVTKVVNNHPEVTICDFRNVTVDPTCGGDADKASFIIESYESSRSELEKLGIYKNLDKIKDSDVSDGNHQTDDSSFRFQDKPRKKFVVYEYWGYWDIDNSGVTTPIVATWVDDVMIRMEVNPYPDRKLPYVFIPYLPVKDSVYGEPDATLLEDSQKLIGAITRGQIDAMARSANAQVGMRKDALDSLNLRKFKSGEDYFFNPNLDPRMAIIEHQYPELPVSTFNLLQMYNMEAEAITGVKTFSSGLTGDALGSTAAGVNGVIGASGKRELGILRRLANGMEEIAKKILAMNSQWLTDDEVIRITDDDFIQINRDNLSGAFDIKLSISNAETDAIKAQELSFMLQTMGGALPFDLTKIILSEISTLRNMPELAKRIQMFQPQPDPIQQLDIQIKQLEAQKLQAEIAQIQSDMFESQAKARKLATEANLNDLKFVEQESGVTQERELELMEAQANSNAKRDVMKAVLDTSLKAKDNKGKQ